MAGGRVWTGRQALAHNLVDELGGLEAAVAEARSRAQLRPDAPVRQLRLDRLETAPPSGGMAAHALDLVSAFNQAAAWWLCPLL